MNYEPLNPRYETSQLFKKNGAINFLIKHAQFETDPVSYLSYFGDIYIGNLKPEVFTKIFHAEKRRYISELISINNADPLDLQPAAFKTMLARVALTTKWLWPAIVNQTNTYDFYTGMGRLLATGMTKAAPWEHLKILLFAHKNNIPNDYLENFSLVSSSQQLHTELNIGYNTNGESQLELEIQHNGQGPGGFVMATMYDGNTDFNYNAGDRLLTNFSKWHNLYNKARPKLYVYTDWPNSIIDSKNIWDIEVAGPKQYTHGNFHLGHLEFMFRQENNTPTHGDNHVLYVTTDIQIDVSDLLTWVDLEHSAWIDQQLQFVLFRPNDPHKIMFVSKSYI